MKQIKELLNKYSSQNKRQIQESKEITIANFFIDDDKNGYGYIEAIVSDIYSFKGDDSSLNGFKELFRLMSNEVNMRQSRKRPDRLERDYWWITYFDGRVEKGFKLPCLDWTEKLLQTSKNVKFSITLEEVLNKYYSPDSIIESEEK